MAIAQFHPEYDAERDHAWHLSCWLEAGLEAWAVHETGTGRLMALFADKGNGLPEDARLPQRPASVTFTAMPETSTLVPESALAPGTELRHLKLVHGKVPTGLLRDEPVEQIGARCIYLHDEQAERQLTSTYPQARSVPLQTLLIKMGLSGNAPAMVLHRTKQRMDLVIGNAGKLELCNTFHATAKEDLLYYALFALEQCGMAPAATALRVGGSHLSAEDEALLSRYFKEVLPLSSGPAPTIGNVPVEEAHHWAALLEQYTCA
ncbi:MAG: DUF3822 family protein [Flavobacteriales bacterium]|jgi:hypothetical protein|nr:DUF3822 family protein [Flavobacteriales bacterium]